MKTLTLAEAKDRLLGPRHTWNAATRQLIGGAKRASELQNFLRFMPGVTIVD